MTIRKITEKENYKADLVSSVAFENEMDYLKEKAVAEAEQSEENAPQSENEEKDTKSPESYLPSDDAVETQWGAFDEDDVCFSAVSVPVYSVRFDGNITLMGGIGGVSTLPHYRRRGGIRECMRAALNDMYESGYTLSYLYPFSRAYYRKFGYENGGEMRTWTLKFNSLKCYNPGGKIKMILPGGDYTVLLDIYNKFCENYNYSVVRRDFSSELAKSNTLSDRRYIYVWYNNAGEARGYIIFKKNNGVMNCTPNFGNNNGFIFLDTQALCGMLDFIQTAFVSNYNTIQFSLPSDINLNYIINEGNNAECSIESCGMARVVNAEAILKMCRIKNKGTLSIKLSDMMIAQNNAVWQIVYAPGKENIVVRVAENSQYDIDCDINSFTALISGICCSEDIPYMPNVKIINKEIDFSDIFYKKKNLILDLF